MKSLSEEKKNEVKRLHKQGYKHREIAKLTGVSKGSVTYVIQERTKKQNKLCNIPQSIWDEWDILHERYGENGTFRAIDRLRTRK